eukprot:TRINITY_DN15639_c0_g1_i3.p1 TRINITY_DN15639_c0_g1~~TRINITY_DN15639_c0_g1_i3.p1  ORF type:complete len:323 (+),score=91.07 TRINITY_DN15639_c0_g1_i3:836-1804(+)
MKESRVMDDSDSEEDEEAAALLAARKRREAIIARHKAAQKELQKVSPAAPEQDELEMNEEMPVDTLMRRADDDGECSEDDEHKVNAGDVDERLMNEDRDHRRGPVFDIFGDAVEEVAANGEAGGKAAALDRGDNVLDKDNWDDADGYYKFQMGEMMHDRYSVYEVSGKGVFSNVLRAKDCKKEGNEVCIKIIRNNDMMKKCGDKELMILQLLAENNGADKHYIVQLHEHFLAHGHLCMVFEAMSMNLREVIKKFGNNRGINIGAVHKFAKQMFVALKHLKRCKVVHADIKPDNILMVSCTRDHALPAVRLWDRHVEHCYLPV